MQPDLQMTTRTSELALSQHRVLRNTYLLLALSLIPTVIGAFIVRLHQSQLMLAQEQVTPGDRLKHYTRGKILSRMAKQSSWSN